MIQHSPATPGRQTARAARPASLKRDINLLPANENSEKIAKRGTIALAVFMGLLLLSYFIIYLPLNHVKDLQDNAASVESQVAMLKAQEPEINSLVDQRNALKEMLDGLTSLGKTNVQPADILAMLEINCPDTITLVSMTKNNEGLAITGAAASDADIAQFIENLKTVPELHGVALVRVQDIEENVKSGLKRQFELVAGLPASVDPAATAAPNTKAKGGDGK